MKYKAAMFDLDGTLIYTLKDIGDSMNSVLKKLGYPTYTIEEYKYLVGEGGRNLALKVLPADCRNEENTDLVLRLYKDEVNIHWADNTYPYDGIPELLEELKNRGIKLTVLTNKNQELTQKVINKFFSYSDFEAVWGACPDYPLKPDPTAAKAIAKQIGVAEEEFLYFGDTDTDMKTANSAGMFAIGVLWGFRKYDELKANGAKITISHPLDIVSLLDDNS